MSVTYSHMRLALRDGLLKTAADYEPTPMVRQLREEMRADPEGHELEKKLRNEFEQLRKRHKAAPKPKLKPVKIKMPPIRPIPVRPVPSAPPLAPALAALGIGSALAGTGAYLIRKNQPSKEKKAEADVVPVEPQEELPQPKPAKPTHPWLTAAKDVGAFGLGVGAGYGGLSLANRLSRKRTGRPLVTGRFAGHAIPVTMGLGSLLFSHWQNTLLDKMREQAAARRASGSQKS